MNYYPRISVITTVFNGGSNIERTILSVINQDYKNIEYIIIDGGSKDNTVDIIKKYSDRIAYWNSEPDKGIYDGMNKGIAQATGEWILFRNCGDYFASTNAISQVFNGSNYNNIDIIYGKLISWDSFGYKIVEKHIEDNLSFKGAMPIPHPSTFVKTAIHKSCSFDTKYKLAADHDFFYKCVKCGRIFKFVPVFVSLFEAEDGASSKYPYISMREHYYIHGGSEKNIFSLLCLKLNALKLQTILTIKKWMPTNFRKMYQGAKYKVLWNENLTVDAFIERAISKADNVY